MRTGSSIRYWINTKDSNGKGLYDKLKERVSKRNLDDGSITPSMTVSTESLQNHVNNLLQLDGAYVLFGGKPISQKDTSKITSLY
jgi:hypothetical protein